MSTMPNSIWIHWTGNICAPNAILKKASTQQQQQHPDNEIVRTGSKPKYPMNLVRY